MGWNVTNLRIFQNLSVKLQFNFFPLFTFFFNEKRVSNNVLDTEEDHPNSSSEGSVVSIESSNVRETFG